MTRTPEQIKADIESHEAALEDLRAALKEAENQPKPGDVYVDQNGRAYIVTPYSDYGTAVTLWRMGSTESYNSKTGAYHGSYNYWTQREGRVLTKVSRASSGIPFNVLTENGD